MRSADQGLLPAIACRYCRTGGAYGRPKGKPHDDGCTTAKDLIWGVDASRGAQNRVLYCQSCGERQSLDPLLWALNPSDLLYCDRCERATQHHPAPPEVVIAEECLCGACRTRRKFEEEFGHELPLTSAKPRSAT